MLDCLIIGQGIGGTCLAFALHEKGYNINIINDDSLPSASKVAAGLIQPITGKYLTSHQLINDNFTLLIDFYKNIESKLNHSIIKSLKTYLYLTSDQEKIVKKKSKNILFKKRLTKSITSPLLLSLEKKQYELSDVFLIDTQRLLSETKNYFLKNNAYINTRFDFKNIKYHNNYCSYNNIKTRHIILCLGSELYNLNFMTPDQFNVVKGDVLILEKQNHRQNFILQTTKWFVPTNNNQFKFGATYSHEQTCMPSQTSYKTLLNSAKDFKDFYYKVICIQSGKRLFSKNKLPKMGFMSLESHLGVFSAFGSKGFSFAPILATKWASEFPNIPTSLNDFLCYGKQGFRYP